MRQAVDDKAAEGRALLEQAATAAAAKEAELSKQLEGVSERRDAK